MDAILKNFLAVMSFSFFTMNLAYADEPSDPCAGLLNLVNRPSQSDSACPVPKNQAILETGITYNTLGRTDSWNLPQAELRVGLPHENEIFAQLPTYTAQNRIPTTGFNATQIGVKHRFGWNQTWVVSMEAQAILPTGSFNYGSNGTGGKISGVVDYTASSTLSFTAMLSLSSLTMPSYYGGQRYTTLSPIGLVTYQFNEKSEAYVEVYGQTRTAANQGAGFDMDVGYLRLLNPNWEADIEAGQRLSGIPTGYNKYVGAGMSFLFG